MKKIILAIAILIAIAGTAQADLNYSYPDLSRHVGGGGSTRCTADMGICDNHIFGGEEDQSLRIHNLEVEIIELKAKCNATPAVAGTPSNQYDAKIASIENRLSSVEKILEALQTNVINLLRTVISVLIK